MRPDSADERQESSDGDVPSLLEQIGTVLITFLSGMQRAASKVLESDSVQQWLAQLQSVDWLAVQEHFEKLPETTRTMMRALAESGWYPVSTLSLADLRKVAKELDVGRVAEVQDFLVRHLESNLDNHRHQLCERFPHRSRVITEAFSAHESSQYFLSVPVFLAQADGICHELTEHQLYKRRNKESILKAYVESMVEDEVMAAWFSALLMSSPMTRAQGEREHDFKGLNRHMVLHGESYDYGTQVNSLKALSLLIYVVDSFEFLKEKEHG